jgi:hypothetical protein
MSFWGSTRKRLSQLPQFKVVKVEDRVLLEVNHSKVVGNRHRVEGKDNLKEGVNPKVKEDKVEDRTIKCYNS